MNRLFLVIYRNMFTKYNNMQSKPTNRTAVSRWLWAGLPCQCITKYVWVSWWVCLYAAWWALITSYVSYDPWLLRYKSHTCTVYKTLVLSHCKFTTDKLLASFIILWLWTWFVYMSYYHDLLTHTHTHRHRHTHRHAHRQTDRQTHTHTLYITIYGHEYMKPSSAL